MNPSLFVNIMILPLFIYKFRNGTYISLCASIYSDSDSQQLLVDIAARIKKLNVSLQGKKKT